MTYDVGLMSHATFQPLFLLIAVARRLTTSGNTAWSDEPISEDQVLSRGRTEKRKLNRSPVGCCPRVKIWNPISDVTSEE